MGDKSLHWLSIFSHIGPKNAKKVIYVTKFTNKYFFGSNSIDLTSQLSISGK